jgi:hypothetical protein
MQAHSASERSVRYLFLMRARVANHYPSHPFRTVSEDERSEVASSSWISLQWALCAPVGSVRGTGGNALMKRFVTLVTVSLLVAATITQWQRLKELSRQLLRGRWEEMFARTSNLDRAEDGDPL